MMDELKALMETPEDLDPELEAYLGDTEHGWQALRHPLVYQVPYHPTWNALMNRQLGAKREQLVEAQRKRNWSQYIWLHERPYRIDAFTTICWRLSDKKYWELLGSIWTDTENLWQNHEIWRECLTAERRFRSRMMSEDERAQVKEVLPNPVTVYRGFSAPGSVQGFSWTTNPIVAKFFARRFAPRGNLMFVAKGTVRKGHVIAFLDGRSEYEVIVMPENVKDIEIAEVPAKDEAPDWDATSVYKPQPEEES
jgi:hypothetical protein